MAKAKPVTEQPEVTTEDAPIKASEQPRNDPRRPATAPEVSKDKPKRTYDLGGGTTCEDY